jgi:plastocyanin
MNKRFGAIATLVAAVAAAAGLFASPSNSAENSATAENCRPPIGCAVALTGAGPSPSTLRIVAGGLVRFFDTDSVTHTVVFANGLCSLTVTPDEQAGGPYCKANFSYYVGSYPYTVDGKFAGTIVTTPWPSSVTLTARTHTIRRGTHLTLHGQVRAPYQGGPLPLQKGWRFPVIVLARHDRRHPFEPIATVPIPTWTKKVGQGKVEYAWKVKVRLGVTTTYIAKSTGQLPQGQFWAKARSRPFTVRVRP